MTKFTRETTATGFTNKGAKITNAEYDETLIEFLDDIETLDTFVQANVHTQGTDQTLDFGGANESSAAEIRTLLDATPVDTWLALTDTPGSFTGQAGRVVVANQAEDAVEFVNFATGLDEWVFDNSTTAPPATGTFRLNNSDRALVTKIYMDNETAEGLDLSTLMLTLTTGDQVHIQQTLDASRVAQYSIDGPATDSGTYVTLDVTIVDEAGSDFQNNQRCSFRADSVATPATAFIPVTGDNLVVSRTIQSNPAGDAYMFTPESYIAAYIEGNTDVTALEVDVYALPDVTLLIDGQETEFSIVGGNRLQYDGVDDIEVVIDCFGVMILSAAGSPDNMEVQLFNNASEIVGISGGSCDIALTSSFSFTGVRQVLSQNDFIDVRFKNTTNGSDVIVRHLRIEIKSTKFV